MPPYGWLANAKVDADGTAGKMRALRRVGVPYSDADIDAAAEQVRDKTEMEALIAYLQGLGTASANW
jgi:cytochrome c oxidase cbb3-type subunit 2